MADISVLNILLYGTHIGTITHIGHDRTLFSFSESYIQNKNRAILGLRFKDSFGELITEFKPTQTALMPYFSNLLPEGHLRNYLSQRAGVKSEREFFLLWALGVDLPKRKIQKSKLSKHRASAWRGKRRKKYCIIYSQTCI